jgi:hypothetical protein
MTKLSSWFVAAWVVLLATAFVLGYKSKSLFESSSQTFSRNLDPTSHATSRPRQNSHASLPATKIVTTSFLDLYDELRNDAAAVREEYAREIEGMSEPTRAATLMTFYKAMALCDLKQGIALAKGITDQRLQYLACTALIEATALPDTKLIVEMLMQLPDSPITADSLNGQLHMWSYLDAPAVAAFFDEHPKINADVIKANLLENWASSDPPAAQAWLEKHAELTQDPEALKQLILGWLKADEQKATDFLVSHSEEERFSQAIGWAALDAYCTSAEAAKALVNKLPPTAKSEALRTIGEINVELVAKDGMDQNAAFGNLGHWLLTFEPAEWKKGVGTMLGYWQQRDFDAMVQWMAALPWESKSAIVAEIPIDSDIPVEKTFQRVFGIPDDSVREQLLRSLVLKLGDNPEERLQIVANMQLIAGQLVRLQQLAGEAP